MILKKAACCIFAFVMLLSAFPFWAFAEGGEAAADEYRLIDPSWFDDAIFFGDSVSGTLQYYANTTSGLGEPTILCGVSYSLRTLAEHSMFYYFGTNYYSMPRIIDYCKADKVFIMLGMNDVELVGPEKAAEYYAVIIGEIREVLPDIPIYIQSCTPSHKSAGEKYRDDLCKLNDLMRVYCEENALCFVDIASVFTGEDGYLPDEYCRDSFVHLSVAAGEIWASALKDPANYSVNPIAAQEGNE